MGRGKTPAGFIDNGGRRRQAFANRREGLLGSEDGNRLGKARELAALCGVRVAVVCADLNGGAPAVLETQPGVLDSYRALPDAKRAEHTHVRYLEDLLGKEKAKLARVRQGGPRELAPPHEEMSRMTLEELRGLLGSVDAALAAAAGRRRALGLPGDDDAVVVPCGDSGPVTTGGSDESHEGYFYPMQQGQGDHGLLDQQMIWPGLQAHDPREHYYDGTNMMMQPAYDPQPQYVVGNGAVYLGGYQQQMPSYGGNYHTQPVPGAYFQPHNAIGVPWNGAFQYDDGSSSHVGTSSSWMQAPTNGNFNNAAVHGLATWSPAESSKAFAGYPYMHTMHTSGNPPRVQYPDLFTGDNNFPDAPAEFLNMDVGGNGMNYHLGGYETRGSSNNLQYSGASQNSSSNQLFGYGSDD
ncbi:hypothetical protein ACQ4PT_057663 [Festuca glaucescens]